MESYIFYLFVVNIVLAIGDASLGYHLAPLLGRRGAEDDEEAEKTTRGMRKLLSGVVALYVFLDCLAFSRGSRGFMIIVTLVILLDMAGQLVVMNKLRKKASD
jgi:hypothetical protein